jgi:hypothetical protein
MMYLLMPDRFANGNRNDENSNQNIIEHYRRKTRWRYEGIIKNLDYIKSLGQQPFGHTLYEDNDASIRITPDNLMCIK